MRLLDLYCGAGGAAVGYNRAGFDEIVGVDVVAQKHYPFTFVQADAFEYLAEHWHEFDAFHGSPVCKGYSVMNNLPWLRGREYPLHILPLREAFNAIGKPYVIENVMGARYGAKGLAKRGLESHGMQAGWLCGLMFGLPLYRHRLFETNWPWLAPGHPKHTLNLHPRSERWVYGGTVKGLPGGMAGVDAKPRLVEHATIKTRSELRDERKRPHPTERLPRTNGRDTLASWQQGNGAQAAGVGVGHAKGWRIAAEAMGVEWMDREGTTQAVPPCYTEFVGRCLLQWAS